MACLGSSRGGGDDGDNNNDDATRFKKRALFVVLVAAVVAVVPCRPRGICADLRLEGGRKAAQEGMPTAAVAAATSATRRVRVCSIQNALLFLFF